jgi:DNA polymerase-1
MKTTIYIVDGSSFAYRAFYAIGQLSTHTGFPTNAVYGFTKMLNRLIDTRQPEYVAVAFDTGKPTFRHKQYEEYKAHRKPMPDELILQIPWIKKIIKAYNMPLIEIEGYEADDVIATMATMAEKEGFSVYIVTGDKDLMQLINTNIMVFNMSKEDIIYNNDKVIERYGVPPMQITQLLALTGDSSDNIPGVDGVGEKTASRLLQKYSSLDNIFENIEELSPKLKTAIKDQKEQVIRNLDLVSVRRDLAIDIHPNECILKGPNVNELKDIFRELEFKALLKGLLEKNSNEKELESTNYTEVNSHSQWNDVAKDLEGISTISLVQNSLAYERKGVLKTVYVVPDAEEKCRSFFQDEILRIVQDQNTKKYVYDLKSMLKGKDFQLKGPVFDAYIAGALLDIRAMEEESRDFAAFLYKEVPNLERKLIEEGMFDLYKRVELPLIEVLSSMENKGIKLDINLLQDLLKRVDRDLNYLGDSIYKSAGEEFNINSPKQLEHILFEKKKLPKGRKTKTGYSTDVDVLESLSKYHELPKLILEYRQLSKLKGTYIEPLPKLIDPSSCRLHTTFNQVGAVTGRLSSSNPNLQNIPIKTEIGRQVRRAFIPGETDLVLIGADYSQIELRILAHLSGDPILVKAFEEDKDIHAQTAQEIFGIDMPETVTEDIRRQAKIVNFGIIYGMGAKALSGQLGISMQEAQKFIDKYFERYPKVSEYIYGELRQAKESGYVLTMFGRKRKVPELSSGNQQLESFGRRVAINTPIQGSAADIIKIAMLNIHKKIEEQKLPLRMLLQIHDELIFEVPEKNAGEMEKFIKNEMENVVGLKVPLKANIKTGRSWADL